MPDSARYHAGPFGDTNLAGIRAVQVEDLLRRKPIELDLPASYIKDRTVLVTGAGGSIGSELVRQAALFEPANVILFGHGENTLHQLHQELQVSMPNLRATLVLGDIRDRAKIDYVMRKFEPSVVFHAAAHKHVPLMEEDPDEAVLNNVGGTRNIAEAALGAGVDRFVNVSTDKAVRPVSMLGATKWLAELVVRMAAEEARLGQSFVSVRFGNVLGSRGSVVRVFEDQIRRGGPITVTDPEMTRYFMTIPEASRLVIQAGAMGQNGGVYVLNMGTPTRIVDLARDMVRLAGVERTRSRSCSRAGVQERSSRGTVRPGRTVGGRAPHLVRAHPDGKQRRSLGRRLRCGTRRTGQGSRAPQLARARALLPWPSLPDVARAVGPIDRDVRDAAMPSSLQGQM